MVIQLLYIKQDVVIEQFSTECRKTKTKVITLANHKGCRAIHCPIKTRSNYTKCRKTCVSNSRLVLVLLVICFGLRKWREFSKPITKHSKRNTKVNAFDTQVKTALRNPIIRIIIQSRGTIPLERFVKAAQTVIILSIIGILASWEPLGSHCKKSIGKIPERIVYFLLKRPIILSTCIRTFAMPRVPSTSTGSNWSFPLVNAGIASLAPWNIRLSWIVNLRSAITKSPGRSFLRIPQLSVRNLSDVLPPQAFDANEILPCGVIPTNIFTVL